MKRLIITTLTQLTCFHLLGMEIEKNSYVEPIENQVLKLEHVDQILKDLAKDSAFFDEKLLPYIMYAEHENKKLPYLPLDDKCVAISMKTTGLLGSDNSNTVHASQIQLLVTKKFFNNNYLNTLEPCVTKSVTRICEQIEKEKNNPHLPQEIAHIYIVERLSRYQDITTSLGNYLALKLLQKIIVHNEKMSSKHVLKNIKTIIAYIQLHNYHCTFTPPYARIYQQNTETRSNCAFPHLRDFKGNTRLLSGFLANMPDSFFKIDNLSNFIVTDYFCGKEHERLINLTTYKMIAYTTLTRPENCKSAFTQVLREYDHDRGECIDCQNANLFCTCRKTESESDDDEVYDQKNE